MKDIGKLIDDRFGGNEPVETVNKITDGLDIEIPRPIKKDKKSPNNEGKAQNELLTGCVLELSEIVYGLSALRRRALLGVQFLYGKLFLGQRLLGDRQLPYANGHYAHTPAYRYRSALLP